MTEMINPNPELERQEEERRRQEQERRDQESEQPGTEEGSDNETPQQHQR